MKYRVNIIYTDDLWYDMIDNSRIKPEEILEYQEDIDKVNAAINLLRQIKNNLEDKGLIEYV